MSILAQVISYIFHPVFMPVLGLFLLVSVNDEVSFYNAEHIPRLIQAILIISALVIMLALMMKNLGFITSLDTENKTERVYLCTLALVCFGAVYYMLSSTGKLSFFHPMIFSAYLGALISMALSAIISSFYKISLHMVGIAGVCGTIYASENLALYPNSSIVLILVMVCGLVGSARLYLQAHKLSEVVSGFALGFLFTYLAVSNAWSVTI